MLRGYRQAVREQVHLLRVHNDLTQGTLNRMMRDLGLIIGRTGFLTARGDLFRDRTPLRSLSPTGMGTVLGFPRPTGLDNPGVHVDWIVARSFIAMNPFHVVHKVPTAREASLRDRPITAFILARVWPVAVTMQAMCFPFVAEQTGSGREGNGRTLMELALVGLQMGVQVFTGIVKLASRGFGFFMLSYS